MWKNQEKRKLVQIPADEIRPKPRAGRGTRLTRTAFVRWRRASNKTDCCMPVCVRKVVGGYELIAGEEEAARLPHGGHESDPPAW